jgi:hypothetical protein
MFQALLPFTIICLFDKLLPDLVRTIWKKERSENSIFMSCLFFRIILLYECITSVWGPKIALTRCIYYDTNIILGYLKLTSKPSLCSWEGINYQCLGCSSKSTLINERLRHPRMFMYSWQIDENHLR